MKSVRVFIVSIGLVGAFIVMAAFMRIQNEKVMKDLGKTAKSNAFAVVELFTSEGCSSCPPADQLVEEIQKENPDKPIYILAFHVDYWDHQGWKDRFSDREYSNRQGQYANWLNLNTVYTPQIVVNGTSEYIGSNASSVLSAISNSLQQEQTKTLKLDAKLEGDKIYVQHTGGEDVRNAELVLALVQKSAESNVRAGENSGRKLSHVQIVRSLVHADINSKKRIAIDPPKDFDGKAWELIGFVQQKNDGRIIAADRYSFQTEAALNPSAGLK